MEDYCYYKNFKIHYKVSGSGPAVVLLHGFTESLDIWNDFTRDLAVSYRVIAVDLPGHGLSECVAPVHTMDMMAACVKKVCDTLDIKQFILIGHSMGGYVSLALAALFPTMVKGLGLFHSHAYADSAELLKNRMRTNNLIRKNHYNFLSGFIPSLFTPENQMKYVDEINALVQGSKKMNVDGVVAGNAGMAERRDCTRILKIATYPVLFIIGKQDTRLPFEKALEQVGLPSDSTALILGDVAHMGYLEAREKTFHAVKTFVDRCYHDIL